MTIGVCSAASVVSDSVTTLAITDRKNCLVRMGGSSERINLSHEFSNQPDPEGPAATQESPSPHVPKRVVKCSDQALVLSCISDPRLSRGFCGREDSSKAPALKGLVCRKLAGLSSLCPSGRGVEESRIKIWCFQLSIHPFLPALKHLRLSIPYTDFICGSFHLRL